MLVVPTDGRALFRLLRSRDGDPNGGDFQPRLGKGAAVTSGVPELSRLALSHYLTRAQAEAVNSQGSRVARVSLRPGMGHFARTGTVAGHVDVWARVEDFVTSAEIES